MLSPNRTLSPSNLNALLPNSNNSNSKAQANVDFPEAVIQENEGLAFILVEASGGKEDRKETNHLIQ